MNNIEGTIFEDYSSVVLDLDSTIWECFTPEGTSIGAYAMEAPFALKSGLLIKDINNNYCKLQEGVRTLIKSLDADDINLGIVSSGEKEYTPLQAQPSVMLLKKFDLYKYFNLYVVCKRGINKREYVRPFGRTLFIDDDNENLEEVKVNEKVDVLDRKVFEDWDQLFQQKASSLHLGLSAFLTKRAREEFQYSSGVDILMSLYKAESNYTLTKRKSVEGDEVTDEENVRYLQTKQDLTGIFENTITYLRDMLTSTIEYSKAMPAYDLVSDKEEYKKHHEEVVPRFENALEYLNEASKYIYNEDHWPQVFVAVDNVVNLMHGDIAYIAHMMMEDEVTLQDKYEGYVKENEIPTFEAEDNASYYTGILEDKWDEFIEFLTLQGKSLEFNTEASQKLSWEVQQDLKNGLNADEQRRDYIIFGSEDAESIGGIISFEISLQQLENLINENFISLDEQVNGGPSVGEFFSFMKLFPGVKALGYTVDLNRSDYRTSLEGLVFTGIVSDVLKDAIITMFRSADEFTLEDNYFRVWWD